MMMIKLERCPVCRSQDIKLVTKDVRGVFKGRSYVAQNVTFYACNHCGEELMDAKTARYVEFFRSGIREEVE